MNRQVNSYLYTYIGCAFSTPVSQILSMPGAFAQVVPRPAATEIE